MLHYIIVDDEVLIRRGLISKIKEITSLSIACAGEAADGIEGLALIEEKNPDIIITDMKMRKMDGMEFLEKIYETYPEKAIIVISGYKAFDYVSKAIEKKAVGYVLKPFSTEEIEKQLQKAAEQIESRRNLLKLEEKVALFEQKKEQDVLLRAILEPFGEAVEAELAKSAYDSHCYYQLMTVYAKEPDSARWAEAVCGQHLNDIGYSVLENPTNNHQYFILLQIDRKELLGKAEVKARHIAGYLEQKGTGGKQRILIGEAVPGFEKLNRSYLQCEKLTRQVVFTDRTSILSVKSLTESREMLYGEEEMKDLFRRLKYKTKEAKELLDGFFEGMIGISRTLGEKSHTIGEIGNTCENLIDKVNEYAVQRGTDTDDIMSVFYKRYLLSDDLDKMKKEISGYVILILNSIEMAEQENDRVFERMQEYILSNCHKKLTLQMLASQFYIPAAGCSSLIKEKLHMSFNDYLGELRMEHAKKLLCETELSAEQISDEIGYSNPKYFFKIFKKTTQMTPVEYRNRHRSKQ